MNSKRTATLLACLGFILLAVTTAWSKRQERVAQNTVGTTQHSPRNTSKKSIGTQKKNVASHRTTRSFLPPSQRVILIYNATIWTAVGPILQKSSVLIRDGRIVAIGKKLSAPNAAKIDAKGRILTPGLIDTHSHMGVYPSIQLRATADGNEMTRPVTAYAWAEHSVWTQDPAFPRAVAGGTTTVQVLPGSANLVGGRGVTLKLKLKRSVHEMKFPKAPHGLKMACGENPKRVHRSIRTRMGSYAGYRRTFLKARAYLRKWERYERALKRWTTQKKAQQKIAQKQSEKRQPTSQKARPSGIRTSTSTTQTRTKKTQAKRLKKPKPPRRDINLDSLKLALQGKILVHIHCYRAEEMIWMIRLSKEFGFKIRSFHHAVEAYKIRDILAREKISVSTWADWWGFKLEAFDGIQENAAMVHATPGGRTIIHSDSAIGVQRLNHEAGKALFRGRAMGLKISDTDALRWITYNAAWALGIHKQTGSIEVGKMADLVLWDGHPFSVYTRTAMVFIDGKLVFDRRWPKVKTDFELGLLLR